MMYPDLNSLSFQFILCDGKQTFKLNMEFFGLYFISLFYIAILNYVDILDRKSEIRIIPTVG